ncbi:MAG: GTPase Era [Alphaproteobacteria bacterium]
MTETPPVTRCGFVALIGAPNAGKSTLVNQLVGAKVSIVTPKVQTTRTRVLGIVLKDDCQLCLIDTPGIFTARRRLDRAMVAAAWSGAADADAIVLIVDASRKLQAETKAIIKALKESGRPAMLALNKIDQIKREALLTKAAQLNEMFDFDATFMISAMKGDGVDRLTNHLAGLMPEGPWLYPEDEISDMPERLLAAEITREQVFLKLHDELPYAMTVETEEYKTQKDGSIRIEQTIYVTRATHKAMILGKGGAKIKAISQNAREQLEAELDCRIHLFCFVKQREGWMDDSERYEAWGLDPNA